MTQSGAEAKETTEEPELEADENSPTAPGDSGQEPEPGLPRMLTDRYRLERLIAKGGMGRVYLATQLPLERKVALKQLVRPSLNDDFRRRFFLEASVLARLSHPNIVVIHDYGEASDGSLFMAMEYLNGASLLDALRREGRLTVVRACEIAGQVCRALRHSHKQGVAHRDLKPGNIMLMSDVEDEEGEVRRDIVKVLDFGLVKVFQEEEDSDVERDLTRAEMMLGSPRYMAPEQIQCVDVDARADVYSMGVVLFAMLTGRPPFVGSTLEILNQHLESPVPGVNELTQQLKGFNAVNSDVEPVLNGIIRRCMEKNPDDRYQSMEELLLELRTAYRLLTDDSLDTPSALDLSHSTMSLIAPTEKPGGGPESSAEASHERLRANPDIIVEETDDRSMAASSGKRFPLLPVIGSALLLGALVLWLLWPAENDTQTAAVSPPPETPTTPTPTPTPVETTTEVSFTSAPTGAEVLQDDEVLGTTPLRHSFERGAEGTQMEFRFRLAGRETTTIQALIAGSTSNVHAELVELEPDEEDDEEEPPAVGAQPSPRRLRPAARRGLRSGARPARQQASSSSSSSSSTEEGETEPPPQPTKQQRPRHLLLEEPRSGVPVVD